MAAAPTPDHQTVLQETFVKLDSFVREHRLGRVFLAPLDVVIRRDPLRTRQPDLMSISNARRYIIGRQVIESGPDLVFEVLSPTNSRREMRRSCKIISRSMDVKPGLSRRRARQSKCFSFPRNGSVARDCMASATSSFRQSCPSYVSPPTSSFQNCRRPACHRADPMPTAKPLVELSPQPVKRHCIPLLGLCATTGGDSSRRCEPVTSSRTLTRIDGAHCPLDRIGGGFTLHEIHSD